MYIYIYIYRYIHIFTFRIISWKLNLKQHYILPVLHNEYHACWCSGDFRNLCISRHGIDTQSRNITSPASEELRGILYIVGSVWLRSTSHWKRCKWTNCINPREHIWHSLSEFTFICWFYINICIYIDLSTVYVQVNITFEFLWRMILLDCCCVIIYRFLLQ